MPNKKIPVQFKLCSKITGNIPIFYKQHDVNGRGYFSWGVPITVPF